MTKPDFEALRAERNKEVQQLLNEIAEKLGCEVAELRHSYAEAKCYCACATGGHCEHVWDGEWYESDDGCMASATCSRCGCTAMSHDMRNAP